MTQQWIWVASMRVCKQPSVRLSICKAMRRKKMRKMKRMKIQLGQADQVAQGLNAIVDKRLDGLITVARLSSRTKAQHLCR